MGFSKFNFSTISKTFFSINDFPKLRPLAAKTVLTKAPPKSNLSAFSKNFSITLILVDTFAPPIITTKGRFGLKRTPLNSSASFWRQKPAADGKNFGTPTIEACFLCDTPNASLT